MCSDSYSNTGNPWFSHFWLSASLLGFVSGYGTWWFIWDPEMEPPELVFHHAPAVILPKAGWDASYRPVQLGLQFVPKKRSSSRWTPRYFLIFIIVCIWNIQAIFCLFLCSFATTLEHENSRRIWMFYFNSVFGGEFSWGQNCFQVFGKSTWVNLLWMHPGLILCPPKINQGRQRFLSLLDYFPDP